MTDNRKLYINKAVCNKKLLWYTLYIFKMPNYIFKMPNSFNKTIKQLLLTDKAASYKSYYDLLNFI